MVKRYDYVIVGGGTAGCVLAARLSERSDVSVCLLEAGGRDWHPFYKIPAGFAKMTKGLGSWGWKTVPQSHLQGRIINFTQAKVIGGGSTINAQVYVRGNKKDFDDWQALGCDGWGYDDVLPYFRKSERNDSFDNQYHGKDGPLWVSKPAAPLPICQAFFEAAAQCGIPFNADMAGERQEGVGHYQLTQKNAWRCSAVMAFLRKARSRKNLHICYGAEAARIMLQKRRAIGVQLKSEIIEAGKEILVTCGAIGSPKLLMLSGLGPADHLRAHGIKVISDHRHIGANLQDHIDLSTIAECTGPHSYDANAGPIKSILAGIRYLLTRSGPAASSLFETGGFWFADPQARSPDIQFHLGLGTGIEAGVANMKNAGVTLNSALLRPRSRGTVRLSSADPAAPPLIDPNYWADPYDREISIRGLKMAQNIMAQSALAKLISHEVLPGKDVQTDKEYFDYACAHAKTDYHPVGTCRMGGADDTVTDPALRVRGVEGLRIADASIMPTLISSNTNATAIMIAEKAADMIKHDI